MAQVTEDMCRRIIADTEAGYSTGLTQWERCQLAWAWLKLNGHEPPNKINIRPRLDLIQRPTPETPAECGECETKEHCKQPYGICVRATANR